MKRRIEKLEENVGASAYGLLLSVGIEPERARELIGPDGELNPRACTDE